MYETPSRAVLLGTFVVFNSVLLPRRDHQINGTNIRCLGSTKLSRTSVTALLLLFTLCWSICSTTTRPWISLVHDSILHSNAGKKSAMAIYPQESLIVRMV